MGGQGTCCVSSYDFAPAFVGSVPCRVDVDRELDFSPEIALFETCRKVDQLVAFDPQGVGDYPVVERCVVLAVESEPLTRPNAKRPAYRLLEEKGIEIFTPMRWRLVERKGKRIREEVPLLHDLLFAHTTRTCMDPIVEEISTLQYRYLRGGYRKPMTVGHAEMNRFIRAVHSDDSPRYFLVEELTPAMYGRMIRIEGGPLDGYEGRLLSIRGARVKRLIVEIPGLLVAAVEVDPEYIRVL